MDKKLKQLFNYQRFAGNADLQKVIDEVNSKVQMVALSDDDLEYVAAGIAYGENSEKPKSVR